MSGQKQGYLLIADITGYTRYLSSSELDHAQGILHTLMTLLIDHTKPPLVVAQLEGDAVFSYGPDEANPGSQTFVEMIENTYVAFRRAIDLMVLNTTCECNACANIGALDLKFFVHHGTFTLQRLGGRDEVVGQDVITVHRLTKNTVPETTGIRAYTLYTEQALVALGLDGFAGSLVGHREEYEHLGLIEVRVQDMGPVWDAKQESLRLEVKDDDALLRVSGTLPVGPEVAWGIITNPQYRAVMFRTVDQKVLDRQGGRMVPGSVYQCFHGGSRVTMQTVLDWHPFEQVTTEDTTPVPKTTMLFQFRLSPSDGGTRIDVVASRARGPFLNRVACDLFGKRIVRSFLTKGLASLEELVAAQVRDGTLAGPERVAIGSDEIGSAVSDGLAGTVG